jgi:hypothetical protein
MTTELLMWGGAFLVLCAGFGVFFAFRNAIPDALSWLAYDFGPVILKAVFAYLFKRLSPKEEADWRQAEREGRGVQWRNDHVRKKLKPWFKG